jgi:phosphotransferase system  glucose/maltose/N-acetylglucosamine-specific IIC component
MPVGPRRIARGLLATAGSTGLLGLAGAAAAGPTNLQETNPILWALIAISAAGAILTYGFLAYALWRFRDPATKGRRYG